MKKTQVYSILWKIFCLIILLPVYMMVVAEGLEFANQSFGMPLWKMPMPGFVYLRDYEGLHRIKLSQLMAVALLITTWAMWCEIFRVSLRGRTRLGWLPETYKKFVLCFGVCVILIDGLLFYCGASQLGGWGGIEFSFTSMLATAAYVCGLMYCSFQSVSLEHLSQEDSDEK